MGASPKTKSAEILEVVRRIESAVNLLNDRVGALETQHKEVVSRIDQIPDMIDETYGSMLNDHEDRLADVERM